MRLRQRATPLKPTWNQYALSRGKFIFVSTKTTALGLLAAGLPVCWVGAQTARDSPESPNFKFGIIVLTECSPIVIGHEISSSGVRRIPLGMAGALQGATKHARFTTNGFP